MMALGLNAIGRAPATRVELLNNIKEMICSSGLLKKDDINFVNDLWTPFPRSKVILHQMLAAGVISAGAVYAGKTIPSKVIMIGGPLLCASAIVVHKLFQTKIQPKNVAEWIKLNQKMMEMSTYTAEAFGKETFLYNRFSIAYISVPEWCSITMAKMHFRFLFIYCVITFKALNQMSTMLTIPLDEWFEFKIEESFWDKYVGEGVTDMENYLRDYMKLHKDCALLQSKLLMIFTTILYYTVNTDGFNEVLNKWLVQHLKMVREIVTDTTKQFNDLKSVIESHHANAHQDALRNAHDSFDDYYYLLQEQCDLLQLLQRDNNSEQQIDVSGLLFRLQENNLTEASLIPIIERSLSVPPPVVDTPDQEEAAANAIQEVQAYSEENDRSIPKEEGIQREDSLNNSPTNAEATIALIHEGGARIGNLPTLPLPDFMVSHAAHSDE